MGDITKLSGFDVPAVDCIIGGSPCQDLSVAGKRAGLSGERSGLFMEQIRITKEMRENDRKQGRTGIFIRPRFMLWENVPGAFSSHKGEDFRSVLEEIVRIAEPDAVIPRPEKSKWTTSGCIMGDGWSVAWRVLDAQFWGVPQRRRRIALVADFGGCAAPEILFVRQSVSGDFDPSVAAKETYPAAVERRADSAVCIPIHDKATRYSGGPIRSGDGAGNGLGIGRDGEPAPALTAADRHCVFLFENHWKDGRLTGPLDVSPTVTQMFGTGGNNTPLIVQQNASGECRLPPVAGTLSTNGNTTGRSAPLILYSQQSFGEYAPSFAAAALRSSHDSNTANLVAAVDCRNMTENPDVNGTLQAKSTGGISVNLQNVVRTGGLVRRLTPLEAERLQEFPGGWTDIGAWTDSKGKLHKNSSDSARYKALGNSIALPPWKWVIRRLCGCYERDATMASLFDGISGFSLLWSQINGPGSVLWTSEIDEFPIAVCKRHFGDEATGEKGDFYEAILGGNKT